jgi:hypothetical protein
MSLVLRHSIPGLGPSVRVVAPGVYVPSLLRHAMPGLGPSVRVIAPGVYVPCVETRDAWALLAISFSSTYALCYMPETTQPVMKRPKLEFDHLPTSRAQVKNV